MGKWTCRRTLTDSPRGGCFAEESRGTKESPGAEESPGVEERGRDWEEYIGLSVRYYSLCVITHSWY